MRSRAVRTRVAHVGASLRGRRAPVARPRRSARRTWSTVTIPRRRALGSTAMIAPSRAGPRGPAAPRAARRGPRAAAPAVAVGRHHRRHRRPARTASGTRLHRSWVPGPPAGRRRRPPGTRDSGSAGRTRRAPGRAVSWSGIATGSASITSDTRRPSIRSVIAVCTSACRAAWPRKQPMKPSQMPVMIAPTKNRYTPEGDHQEREDAAQAGGEAGGLAAVAGAPPGDRARDPPAVERERRGSG